MVEDLVDLPAGCWLVPAVPAAAQPRSVLAVAAAAHLRWLVPPVADPQLSQPPQ
jgi:hypothetical protein